MPTVETDREQAHRLLDAFADAYHADQTVLAVTGATLSRHYRVQRTVRCTRSAVQDSSTFYQELRDRYRG